MKIEPNQIRDRFFLGEERLAWTDFERLRYLRELVSRIRARIDLLLRHPTRNADLIQKEMILFEKALQELKNLEQSLL